ncbi:MAG TPA: PIG-L family deacetylase [Thermoguttaceae bacterium]|nr:PIG-L family deacetylase [Thermoguttaceae bacterium]
MRTWQWFSLGIVAGLLAAAGFGFAQPAVEPAEEAAVVSFAGQPVRPDDGKLGIIEFGAHPDDCEIRAGGVGAMWSDLGHHVKFVSTTNGDIGHWGMAGGPLAKRRNAEVQAAAKILGVTTEVLDIHDGELMPTLENRKIVTRLIRQWNADIVIAHRPNDYHPDHRYTGVLMQDSAYMVGVPFLCPDTPPLKKNPVFLYSADRFQTPVPFRADIVVSIDGVIERKLDALAEIESQFIEGGAMGSADRVPKTAAEKKAAVERLRESFRSRFADTADRYRDKLIELYGEAQGRQVRCAEAFEICEYGRQPSPEEIRRLFPFFPERN